MNETSQMFKYSYDTYFQKRSFNFWSVVKNNCCVQMVKVSIFGMNEFDNINNAGYFE